MTGNRSHARPLVGWGRVGIVTLLCLRISAQQTETIPTELNIVVVEGEGAVNKAGQRVTPEPRIRVEDEAHHPIAGAAVVFTLPTEGATGEFHNGSKTLVLTTDRAGEASAQGLRMNEVPGKTFLHVSVSYKGLSARTIISEENVLPPGVTPSAARNKHGHGALIAILVIVAGAAAGGAVYASQRGGGSSPAPPVGPTGPTPIGITPGTGTVVGGH
jgi:hypothetical protein